MPKLTIQQLLAEAKKRQASRRKSSKKLKKIQERLPEGQGADLASFALNVAGDTRLTDAAQYAFTNRLLDEMILRGLRNAPSQTPAAVIESVTIPEMDVATKRRAPTMGVATKRTRSEKQMVNDQIQSNSLKAINKKARKKDGTFKKGWSQKKVMRLAQKECTKERERLGLCKRKSTRKGQRRKTARRAYEK